MKYDPTKELTAEDLEQFPKGTEILAHIIDRTYRCAVVSPTRGFGSTGPGYRVDIIGRLHGRSKRRQGIEYSQIRGVVYEAGSVFEMQEG